MSSWSWAFDITDSNSIRSKCIVVYHSPTPEKAIVFLREVYTPGRVREIHSMVELGIAFVKSQDENEREEEKDRKIKDLQKRNETQKELIIETKNALDMFKAKAKRAEKLEKLLNETSQRAVFLESKLQKANDFISKLSDLGDLVPQIKEKIKNITSEKEEEDTKTEFGKSLTVGTFSRLKNAGIETFEQALTFYKSCESKPGVGPITLKYLRQALVEKYGEEALHET